MAAEPRSANAASPTDPLRTAARGTRPGPVAPPMDLAALIADPETRILVCCGSGGVGKTTTSAALALAAAEAGRTVVVLTIDPARRLAQSLGLKELDNEPRRVDVPGADGELHAMMLDMKRTFDDIVTAHSTPERAEQILENPFYQALSSSFSGTQEYMAMEKLGQLRASDQWDLIIVDTPPSRSALDFLDAPNRMSRFRWPGRVQVRQRGLPVLQPDHLQDPGRPAAAGHLCLRRCPGHHVRRLPGAGDGNV
jgi:Mrp family chromosome partitioning ATPase